MLEKIRKLIAADKVESAIEDLLPHVSANDELTNDLIKYQADLARNKKEHRQGKITDAEADKTRTRVCYAILEMLQEIDPEPGQVRSIEGPRGPLAELLRAPTVFISYNHGDSDIADRVKTSLEKNGIPVRIDKAVMEAGANIQEFIESSIRDTAVTLSIVSNRSLLSAWVALESIDSFYREKFANKKFIACYVDDDFFRTDFRLNATRQIDAKIQEIDNLIPAYIAEKIDTNDLNSQKSRLFKLRNNLGDILLRLRESLCIDIREPKFDDGVARIVEAISRSDKRKAGE